MFFILFLINLLLAVVSLGIFLAANISPSEYWIAGFMSYLVPFALFLNFLFVCLWLIFSKLKALVSLLVFLAGAPFVKSTLTFNRNTKFNQKSEGDFDVMSYNVRVFNAYASWKNKKEHSGQKIVDWISREINPDIVCFQEFYQNKREDYLDVVGKMKRAGYANYYFYIVKRDAGGGLFGMAIFSKFPIQEKGEITFKQGSNNMAMYVDVKIAEQVIRIFNIHLESLSIDEKKVLDIEEVEHSNLLAKLKNGFQKRALQIQKVLKAAKSSPYKSIICGDWNDLPYGYSYTLMKQSYKNAFEEAGSGFGFTYNGKMSFLRIDNQFFNEDIHIKRFGTIRNLKVSDHFPILARYNLD